MAPDHLLHLKSAPTYAFTDVRLYFFVLPAFVNNLLE